MRPTSASRQPATSVPCRRHPVPVKAFAVAHIVNDYEWHEASVEKGILFDRVRIVNSLSDGAKDMAFRQELSAWVEQQLVDLED